MRRVLRKPVCFTYARTMVQIKAPLFSQYRKYDPSSFLIQNFKHITIFCSCTARFLLYLKGNPKGRFSRYETRLQLTRKILLTAFGPFTIYDHKSPHQEHLQKRFQFQNAHQIQPSEAQS